MEPKKENSLKSFLYEALGVVLLVLTWTTFVFSLGYVPSSSMEPTLKEGDVLFRNMLAYGGKTPDTIGVPHAPKTIFGIRTYLPFVHLPTYRAPGYAEVKKSDVATFHQIHKDSKAGEVEKDVPIQRRSLLVKRNIAGPGDTIRIENGRISVQNESKGDFKPGLGEDYRQYTHQVCLSEQLSKDFLDKNTVSWSSLSSQGKSYELVMTKVQAVKYKRYLQEHGIVESSLDGTECQDGEWLLKKSREGATDYNNLKDFKVPSKGDKIELKSDGSTHPLYLQLIQNLEPTFEKKKIATEKGGDYYRFYIKGRQVSEYTCCEDMFFFIGDNFHGSYDSRAWGPVPRSHITSRVEAVLFNIYSRQAWGGFLLVVLLLGLLFYWLDKRRQKRNSLL